MCGRMSEVLMFQKELQIKGEGVKEMRIVGIGNRRWRMRRVGGKRSQRNKNE